MKSSVFFDYSSYYLSDARVCFLEKCACATEYQSVLDLAGIHHIGKSLNSARAVFGEDRASFSRWLKSRLPFITRDFAFRVVSLYRRFGVSLLRKDVSISDNVLFSLLSPSTSYPAVTEIISRALSGESISWAIAERVISRRLSSVEVMR